MFTRYLFAIVVELIVAPPTFADKPAPPRSYKVTATGGKYIFVMISPEPLEQEAKRWSEEAGAEMREIRRVYSRSGMYRNDGPTEPLWTVDWYAHGVKIAPDGTHLIRHGPWAPLRGGLPEGEPVLDIEAISFFAKGQLLRTYRVNELVTNPDRLQRTASHYFWASEETLDENRMEYALTTLDGNRFVFDLRTGLIVSETRVPREWHWGWWAAGGTVLLAVAVWLARVLPNRLATARARREQ